MAVLSIALLAQSSAIAHYRLTLKGSKVLQIIHNGELETEIDLSCDFSNQDCEALERELRFISIEEVLQTPRLVTLSASCSPRGKEIAVWDVISGTMKAKLYEMYDNKLEETDINRLVNSVTEEAFTGQWPQHDGWTRDTSTTVATANRDDDDDDDDLVATTPGATAKSPAAITSGTSTLTPTGRVALQEITKQLGHQFNIQQFLSDLTTVEIPQSIIEEIESLPSVEDQISKKYDVLDSMKDNKVRELTALFTVQLEQGKIHAFDIKRAVNNIYVPALERRWKRMAHYHHKEGTESPYSQSHSRSAASSRSSDSNSDDDDVKTTAGEKKGTITPPSRSKTPSPELPETSTAFVSGGASSSTDIQDDAPRTSMVSSHPATPVVISADITSASVTSEPTNRRTAQSRSWFSGWWSTNKDDGDDKNADSVSQRSPQATNSTFHSPTASIAASPVLSAAATSSDVVIADSMGAVSTTPARSNSAFVGADGQMFIVGAPSVPAATSTASPVTGGATASTNDARTPKAREGVISAPAVASSTSSPGKGNAHSRITTPVTSPAHTSTATTSGAAISTKAPRAAKTRSENFVSAPTVASSTSSTGTGKARSRAATPAASPAHTSTATTSGAPVSTKAPRTTPKARSENVGSAPTVASPTGTRMVRSRVATPAASPAPAATSASTGASSTLSMTAPAADSAGSVSMTVNASTNRPAPTSLWDALTRSWSSSTDTVTIAASTTSVNVDGGPAGASSASSATVHTRDTTSSSSPGGQAARLKKKDRSKGASTTSAPSTSASSALSATPPVAGSGTTRRSTFSCGNIASVCGRTSLYLGKAIFNGLSSTSMSLIHTVRTTTATNANGRRSTLSCGNVASLCGGMLSYRPSFTLPNMFGRSPNITIVTGTEEDEDDIIGDPTSLTAPLLDLDKDDGLKTPVTPVVTPVGTPTGDTPDTKAEINKDMGKTRSSDSDKKGSSILTKGLALAVVAGASVWLYSKYTQSNQQKAASAAA